MDLVLTLVRALHYAACIVLFGEYAYAWVVAPDGRPRPRFVGVAAWSLGVAVASAAAWLAIEAGHMSGEPIAQALGDGTWRIVLGKTLFGHTWLVRAALALGLALSLVGMGREGRARSTPSPALPQGGGRTLLAAQGGGRTSLAIGAVCAALLLVSLSCAGHAAAEGGRKGLAHICVDGFHLLAAGAWLGALLPLAAVLRESAPGSLARAALAVRRFSLLGMACVGVLLLSGLANTSFALHHVSDFVDSRYGRELLAKLALVGAIVALAAVNRLHFTPRLESADARSASAAQRSLLHSAIAEVVLGFVIVAIVANLGITMPPMHAGG
jgi:putative copper resistance protein D